MEKLIYHFNYFADKYANDMHFNIKCFHYAIINNTHKINKLKKISNFQNYEIRKLPAAKWACTKETNVDPLQDPMKDWREKVCMPQK